MCGGRGHKVAFVARGLVVWSLLLGSLLLVLVQLSIEFLLIVEYQPVEQGRRRRGRHPHFECGGDVGSIVGVP